MEKQTKMKKSTKYLLIGTLVLFLSILGASMAYYLARVQGNLSGRAAGTELTINVEKLSTNANMDLIPLDNDLETLNLAAAGYQDKGACVDINGYSVCQIYHITLTNKGSVPLTINGTVTLSGQNVPNIDCAKMNDEETITDNNSCKSGMFVSGDTLAANSHNDYYVMVYIKNLDEPQYDSGEFNGTVTFTSEDGKKVKGRFTKPFNLVNQISNLYTDAAKTVVTANADCERDQYGDCSGDTITQTIDYNYATSVNLMNDRLGGTTTSLDGGNIRYYGAEPNNYIDIGDKTEVEVTEGNWVSVIGSAAPFSDSDECYSWAESDGLSDEIMAQEFGPVYGWYTIDDMCGTTTTPAGTPILWRIIGVFDGKLRIRRDENIGYYSYDRTPSDINNGKGINEWSQADLMKLLNPGFETNTELDSDGTTEILINNSLYWNSGSGNCYSYEENASACDFTNTGLSNEAKEYVVDQSIFLGGLDTGDVFANNAWAMERGNNVYDIQSKRCDGAGRTCNDTVTRTLSWKGKVGLIYPSDYLYAVDFRNENCQSYFDNLLLRCKENWMAKGYSWTISPYTEGANSGVFVTDGSMFNEGGTSVEYGGWPTLLLDSTVLAESGNGSKETPYVVAY